MPSRISTSGSSCRSRRGIETSSPALLPPLVVLPFALIRLGAAERVANDELDAGPRHRIAARSGLAELPHVFRILAERELDPRRRAFEHQRPRVLAPAQLDHLVLAADRIGAAVQHVRHRQPAGEVAIDRHVGGIEHVLDAGHRADRRAAFVDRVGGDVRVRVDDAGRDEASLGIDDVGARRECRCPIRRPRQSCRRAARRCRSESCRA